MLKNWNLPCFVAKSVGLQFTLFYRKICFVAIYALFVWRKFVAKNVPCGEKMTNMMYEQQQQILGVQQKILDHLTQLKANMDQLKDGAAQSTSQEGQASAGQSHQSPPLPQVQ